MSDLIFFSMANEPHPPCLILSLIVAIVHTPCQYRPVPMSASGKKRSRLNLRAEPLPPRLEQATPPESQNTRSSLVLSIDVGTSTSAVTTHHWVSTQSYESETNDEPDPSNKVSRAIVTNIASWPGHEGSSFYEEKVPSLLIYDNDGKVCDLVDVNYGTN